MSLEQRGVQVSPEPDGISVAGIGVGTCSGSTLCSATIPAAPSPSPPRAARLPSPRESGDRIDLPLLSATVACQVPTSPQNHATSSYDSPYLSPPEDR